MRKTTTQDYAAYEEEADMLLSVFENLPDALFNNAELRPHEFIISSIKAFARSYQSMNVLGCENGMVIN
ncbi:hypothetical protein KDU71_03515 [Carboxylicivirga sediminis]|uniref:Uncharacterized protein n=1 Tax=Carboxylicivirga sediminis TaxID=2006564 RepID=A0A941IVN7_9BACT|nr:hypothetical protein [Carboxylicivirga sediminis]MBR8534615.1 hypothetical protein [Carboxylicivirga sediminis]